MGVPKQDPLNIVHQLHAQHASMPMDSPLSASVRRTTTTRNAPLINYSPTVFNIGNTTHHHNHANPNQPKQDKQQEDHYALALFITLMAAAVATYLSGYATQHIADDLERLNYDNEGTRSYLDAAIILITGVLIGGLGSAWIASLTPAAFLIGLATLAFAVIGMAVGTFIASPIADFLEKHADPLSQHDAYRFDLTTVEEGRINETNLDLILVKCAILAIRDRILQIKQETSYSDWSFYRNEETVVLLEKLRALRSGQYQTDSIQIGELCFLLTKHPRALNPSAPVMTQAFPCDVTYAEVCEQTDEASAPPYSAKILS